VSPPPNLKHQAVIGVIHFFLHQHVRQFGGGRVYVAPTGVVLSEHDAVEPDVLFVSDARLGILVPKFVHGAPDLVVEVGSPSTRRRDLRDKLRLYERSGVSEYWFADPELDSVAVYRLVDGRFIRALELSRDTLDTLTSPLLPGLAIPLAEVFAE
jgi:Uma2 family endonuclease